MMLLIATLLAAVAPIAIAIEGDQAFFMAQEVTVRVIMRIPFHPDNRFAVLAWDSDDGDAGASYIYNLEEDQLTYRFSIRFHPGHYVLAGILGRVGGEELLSEPRTLVIVPAVPQ